MLYLNENQKERLVEHSKKEAPNEACGILAGKDQRVEKIYEMINTDNSAKTAHTTYRRTGHEDPSTQAPEGSSGATGVSTVPNPDNLDPTGGEKAFLWLAGHGNDGAFSVSVYPTSYSNGIDDFGQGIGSVGVASAERELTATTENPGTFTVSGSSRWVAGTIAVHPATAGIDIPSLTMAPYTPT